MKFVCWRVKAQGFAGDLPPSDRSSLGVGIERGREQMARKRHTPEQMIRKLREAEVELSKGQSTGEVVRKRGITEQTYYLWRKEYGGLRLDQAKRLKELEKENSRLKKLLAEQALDNAILKEAASGNF
jgi:transposase-like protein